MRRLILAVLALACVAAVPALAELRSESLVVTLTNSRLVLSRPTLPTGSAVIVVVNKGTTARRVTVAGTKTAPIAPGRKVTLKLLLTRIGAYALVSPGKPKTLNGTLRVVASPSAPAAGSKPPATAPAQAGSCAKPAATTVVAQLDDGKYTFSQGVIPCGTVSFDVTNVGKLQHSLFLETQGGEGPILSPGQTAHMVVSLPPGGLYYVDGVYEIDLGGAVGTLSISG